MELVVDDDALLTEGKDDSCLAARAKSEEYPLSPRRVFRAGQFGGRTSPRDLLRGDVIVKEFREGPGAFDELFRVGTVLSVEPYPRPVAVGDRAYRLVGSWKMCEVVAVDARGPTMGSVSGDDGYVSEPYHYLWRDQFKYWVRLDQLSGCEWRR